MSQARAQVDITRLPPWLFAPPGRIPFSPTNYVALGAIGTDTVIVSFSVPQGENGVINQLGNNIVGAGFTDGSGALIWRIKQNDAFVRNFTSILAAANPAIPLPIAPIQIYEGDLIQLIGSNVSLAVAGQVLGGRLGGYFYPREIDDTDVWY